MSSLSGAVRCELIASVALTHFGCRIQQDKEAGYHVLANTEMVNTQPPARKTESMSYPA